MPTPLSECKRSLPCRRSNFVEDGRIEILEEIQGQKLSEASINRFLTTLCPAGAYSMNFFQGRKLQLRRFFRVAAVLSAIYIATLGPAALAQELVQAPRRDKEQTPLRVYSPSAMGCAPLALISPGAGGSEDGYSYLAKALRDDGWRAIVMGHRESGGAALWSDMREAGGIKRGLQELVNDPAAYTDGSHAVESRARAGQPRAPHGHRYGQRTAYEENAEKKSCRQEHSIFMLCRPGQARRPPPHGPCLFQSSNPHPSRKKRG